jgi:signal peptidase I
VETAAPAPKSAPQSFRAAARAQLKPEEQKALERVLWVDRLTSLWAPVTVLGLVFLVYLVIVESSVCTYSWLLTPMQVFGALCFFWWAALVVSRYTVRKFTAARTARTVAEELLGEVETQVKRHRAQLKDKAYDDLTERSSTLWRAFALGEKATEDASKALDAASAKHLSHLKRSSVLDVGGGFVKALIIALAIRTVLVEPFKIPSGSMLPTLEIGDQIFVNKFIYGVRIPFTNTVPFVIVRPPKRGDVIVFNNPVRPDVDYIKRVIGVPGDHLEVKDRLVYLNGQPLAQEREGEDVVTWEQRDVPTFFDWLTNPRQWFVNDWVEERQSLSRETIDGQRHWVMHRGDPKDRMVREGEMVVPEGHVFVMGDNRDNSLDSRFGLGLRELGVQFVPMGNIKGKATVIWLALGHQGLLSSIFGGTGVRTDRFFRPVTMCGTEPLRTK